MDSRIVLLLAMCTLAAAYTDVDDSLNVEELVKDVPTLRRNLNCYLDKGPCTERNLGYKSHFMEVVDDGCRECNDRERHMFRVFLRGLRDNLPAEYKAFREKYEYDPDNKHFDAAAAAVQNY